MDYEKLHEAQDKAIETLSKLTTAKLTNGKDHLENKAKVEEAKVQAHACFLLLQVQFAYPMIPGIPEDVEVPEQVH